MNITLNPAVVELLGSREDAEELVNSIAYAYLTKQIIRKSDIAGVVATRPFHRSAFMGYYEMDLAGQQFKGVVVEGSAKSESLYIASPKLQKLLEENQVVIVMKSPRTRKPHTENPDMTLVLPTADEQM